MTLTTSRSPVVTAGRRAGYVVAIIVNAALMYVANQLLAWELLPFLTSDFNDLLPFVNVSLALTIAFNAAYLAFDPSWFRHLSEFGLTLVGLVVLLATWIIFPFDFSAYSFDWDLATRVLMIFAALGMSIGMVVELVKFRRAPDA